MKSEEYYERYWSDEGFNPRGGVLPVELRDLLQAKLAGTKRCLDVGCGTGDRAAPWVIGAGIEYVGVDISEAAVQEAQRLGLDVRKIDDASSLPFPDCSFDSVICFEVLEHLFEPQNALLEMRRVLRPGGNIVVTVPNVAYWRRRLELAAGMFHPFGDILSLEQPWRDPHIRFFTVDSLRRLAESCGFIDVVVSGHQGAFIADLPRARKLPVLKHLQRGPEPEGSRIYNRLRSRCPQLLGLRLNAVACRR